MRSALVLCLWCIPSLAQAAVIINEVAWMGSTVSANHEWIELKNTGTDSIDVSGWKLADGMNLVIELAGVIPAGSYAVLERSSEDSASGTAFLIYTGALVNSGATLSLTRADGGLEDQIAGGENWQNIGGDNVTKETAQYTTGGWVTGAGTPGTSNSGVPKSTEGSGNSSGSTSSGNGSKNGIMKSSPADETVRLTLPGVTLSLAVEGQKVGYVHQPIKFLVTPSGVGKTIAESLVYDWNFGDGLVAYGKEVAHSFHYPGKYVVTVYGLYKRQEQVTRHEITILPVALSLTRSKKGEIQIHNDAPYEIDISQYRVTGSTSFTFPDYSVLLPNQTITLSKTQVGEGFIVVRDAERNVVVTELQSSKTTPADVSFVSQALRSAVITSQKSAVTAPVPNFVLAPQEQVVSYPEPNSVDESIVGTTTSQRQIPEHALPYIGLVGTILIGLIGTGIRGSRNQNG